MELRRQINVHPPTTERHTLFYKIKRKSRNEREGLIKENKRIQISLFELKDLVSDSVAYLDSMNSLLVASSNKRYFFAETT